MSLGEISSFQNLSLNTVKKWFKTQHTRYGKLTHMKPSPPLQPTSQPASFIVVDDQQPGHSRQLAFALSPAKSFNPPLVTSNQVEESQHNTYGFSSLSGILHPYCSTSRSTHLNHFPHHKFNQHHHQFQRPLGKNQQDPSASPANRVSPVSYPRCVAAQISLHMYISGLLTSKRPFLGPSIQQKKIHRPTPHTPPKDIQKLSERVSECLIQVNKNSEELYCVTSFG